MIATDSRRTAAVPRLRVGFILARRFTLSAFANFVDVLRLAADEGDRSRPIRCGWRVLSSDMGAVTSSCGIAVRPDERLGDPGRFDYIVVVGGLVEELERLDPDYAAFLRRAAAAGVPLAGVCTGAFILHRAGLMEGYRCCVSWFHHDDFLEQFAGLRPVSDQIFVVDRDRLTCSGGVGSAHLAQGNAEEALRWYRRGQALDDGGPAPAPGARGGRGGKLPVAPVHGGLSLVERNHDQRIEAGGSAGRRPESF